MTKTKKVGSTGRFGARYGIIIRRKVHDVEKAQKSWYKCPSCNAKRVKRISTGIWQCRKCQVKFASRAYSMGE